MILIHKRADFGDIIYTSDWGSTEPYWGVTKIQTAIFKMLYHAANMWY